MKRIGQALAVLLMASAPCLAAEGAPAAVDLGTFTVLVGVIAGLFVLAWAAKKYGPYARARKIFGLDILGQVPVGPKSNLALVRAGKTLLLLGVTQHTVTLIKDLGQDDFGRSIDEAGLTGREPT